MSQRKVIPFKSRLEREYEEAFRRNAEEAAAREAAEKRVAKAKPKKLARPRRKYKGLLDHVSHALHYGDPHTRRLMRQALKNIGVKV